MNGTIKCTGLSLVAVAGGVVSAISGEWPLVAFCAALLVYDMRIRRTHSKGAE